MTPYSPPLTPNVLSNKTPTKTDHKLKRIYNRSWLLVIFGLLIIIALLGLLTLYPS